jgi:hypothetical protein
MRGLSAAVALPTELLLGAHTDRRERSDPVVGLQRAEGGSRREAVIRPQDQPGRIRERLTPNELRPGDDGRPAGRHLRGPALARLVVAHVRSDARRRAAAADRERSGDEGKDDETVQRAS